MEGLIINNGYLRLHPLWDSCSSTLFNIANRDYSNKSYFRKLAIDALDIDSYEKGLRKGRRGNLNCTGDAVIGVALEKSGETLTHPFVMIVELRMGYKNGDNISLSKLKRKITYTKTLLSTNLQIYHNYYFVFTDKEEPQARSVLNREAQELGRMQNYKITSVSEFTSNMIDPSQVTDEFQYEENDILKSFNRCFSASACDVDCFSRQFYHWLGIIDDMKARYNQLEAKHIAECLHQVLVQIKQVSLNEEEQILVDILSEDLVNKGVN